MKLIYLADFTTNGFKISLTFYRQILLKTICCPFGDSTQYFAIVFGLKTMSVVRDTISK